MPEDNAPQVPTDRLVSLDALRGFDMIWIIGLSRVLTTATEGSSLPFAQWLNLQFEHSTWVGFNAWDLIMPLFVFMCGTSMPFSFGKRLARGDSKFSLYNKVFRRFIILWILGIACGGNLLKFDPDNLLLYSNTLQSIAAGYLIAAVVFLNCNILWQALVTFLLMLIYWALLCWAPTPGFDPGTLTVQGNFAMYIDKLVLGDFMRQDTTYTWVLSSMVFGSTVLLGVLAGHILRSAKWSGNKKTLILLGLGAAGIGLGWVWGLQHPIIKRIWTSSMVLYAGGWSFLLMGIFYWVIDVCGFKKWAFVFVVVGLNAITIYSLKQVFGGTFNSFAQTLSGGLANHMGDWGGTFVAFTRFAAQWTLVYVLYKNRIFLRV